MGRTNTIIRPLRDEKTVTLVKIQRISHGWTQRDLARMVHVTDPMVCAIENGGGTSARTASAIARTFQVRFEELFEVVPRNGIS